MKKKNGRKRIIFPNSIALGSIQPHKNGYQTYLRIFWDGKAMWKGTGNPNSFYGLENVKSEHYTSAAISICHGTTFTQRNIILCCYMRILLNRPFFYYASVFVQLGSHCSTVASTLTCWSVSPPSRLGF